MTLTQSAWQGETVYLEEDIRLNPWPDEVDLRRYRVESVVTTRPSWAGARVGAYKDALQPLEEQEEGATITALHVRHGASAGVRRFRTAAGGELELMVLPQQLPKQRLFPFYSEVNSEDLRIAYRGITGEEGYSMQGKLSRHAIDLVRSFGMEPSKQAQYWFDNPCASWEEVSQRMDGPYGYRELVFSGAIAPPLIWCGSISDPERSYAPHPTFLNQVNALAPEGTMAWCADEPEANGIGNGMTVREAVERVRYVLLHAPRLIPMITTGIKVLPRLQELAGNLPIRYTIVQNEDQPSLLSYNKGSYFSCMAQGCDCNDNKKRTTCPVAVLEGDCIDDFQAALHLAKKNKAIFALYYKVTENLNTCWAAGGLYKYGGNGDGTALYIDRKTGLAIPSLRLMHWHLAQQEIEKQMLSG